MLGVSLIQVSNGALVKDLSFSLPNGYLFSTNRNGFKHFQADIPDNLIESFRVYDRPGLLGIVVSGQGAIAWDGRVEDVTARPTGYRLLALGHQNGYRDKRQVYSPTAYSAAASKTIVTDIISSVSSANSYMSSSTLLCGSPALTWTEEFERQTPADILDRVAQRGDGSTIWEWNVWENRLLGFRARGAIGKQWRVDVSNPEVTRSLEQVWNSVYGVYADTVTAEAANAVSQDRYGVKREIAINAQTDDSTVAANFRDAWLDFYKESAGVGSIDVDAIYDPFGARYPVWMARSGDTVGIRNLPPALSTDIDRIRSFRVSETTVKFPPQPGGVPVLSVTPEFGPPVI